MSVTRQGSCAQIGMVAKDDIKEGEVLFEIPRKLLLDHTTTELNILSDSKLYFVSTLSIFWFSFF